MSEVENKEGGARVRFPPPFVFIAGVVVGAGLQHLAPLRLGVSRGAGLGLGLVIVAVGLALLAWAGRTMRRTGQDPAPWKPSPSMIAAGPYRRSRNPMYVGMTIMQLGIGVAKNNLWIELFAFVALLGVHYLAVLPEEAYLAARFGDDYARYRASVRRYF
jgi:protein-S-isoprenylcysteine O-methyltransferase Ste14